MVELNVIEYLEFSCYVNLLLWVTVFLSSIIYYKLPIFHPFFLYLIYHFLGFVIRPFKILEFQNSFLWSRIGFSPTSNDIILITLITNIALLSAFIGFIAYNKNKIITIVKPPTLVINDSKKFIVITIIIIFAGLYGTYVSLVGAGFESVLAYKTSLDSSAGQRLVGVSGYQTALAEFLPITLILLFMIPKTRKISIILISLYIAIRMYAGGQRLSFVVVLVALFFYYHMQKLKRYPKIFPVILILLFMFIFDILGNDRYAFRSLLAGNATPIEILDNYLVERGGNSLTSDIVEYDVATAASSFISDNSDFSYGTQYLRILIWPIPRQIWNDKPVYTSIVDLNKYGDFRYLTTSLYADSYMNLSFPFLIIIMFLLGYFFSYIYNKMLHTNKIMLFMFFWIVLIYTKTILRDGGVTFIYFWIFSLIAVYLITKIGKVKICRKKEL